MAMKRSNVVSILVLTVICACCKTAEPLGIAARVANKCNEENLDQRFFRGVFAGTSKPDMADAAGVSTLLASLGEPSLSCDVNANEAYRLIYMPERGEAMSIRVEHLSDTYNVTVSSDPTENATAARRQTISQQEWNKVKSAIERYNFWSRPPYPSPSMIGSGVVVLHGPAWLLEGQRDGWYHAVTRAALEEADFELPVRALFEIVGAEMR